MEGEGLKCTVHVWCLPCHPRHLMLLSPPTPLNIFYKCAKLRGLCQKSSVTGTSINQVGNTLQPWSYVIDSKGLPAHLPSHGTQTGVGTNSSVLLLLF